LNKGYVKVCSEFCVNLYFLEAEVHWRKFLESLSARGLHGVKMITSDNHFYAIAKLIALSLRKPFSRQLG